jgi:hypothetical protein
MLAMFAASVWPGESAYRKSDSARRLEKLLATRAKPSHTRAPSHLRPENNGNGDREIARRLRQMEKSNG